MLVELSNNVRCLPLDPLAVFAVNDSSSNCCPVPEAETKVNRPPTQDNFLQPKLNIMQDR